MAQIRVRKSAAYDAGIAAYNDFKHGNIGITSKSITVNDFMTTWIENIAANNVKPLTLSSYRSLFEKYIAPHLSGVRFKIYRRRYWTDGFALSDKPVLFITQSRRRTDCFITRRTMPSIVADQR